VVDVVSDFSPLYVGLVLPGSSFLAGGSQATNFDDAFPASRNFPCPIPFPFDFFVCPVAVKIPLTQMVVRFVLPPKPLSSTCP